jgi:phosphopantothenoylcysteine decarboxylase/phosphopantothenate--cysteine ligase
MGVAIAEEAWSRGAETTLILGPGSVIPPPSVKTVRVETTEEMLEATVRELKRGKHDLVFAAAAPSDYRPSKPIGRKISTRKEKTVELQLEATPKIIREIRLASPNSFLVAFKTEHGVSNEQLVTEAFEILSGKGADLVAANDVSIEGVGFQTDTNELFVVDERKKVTHIALAPKREVARQLLDIAVKRLKG